MTMSEARLISEISVHETRERALCGWRSTPMVEVSGKVYQTLDMRDLERYKYRLSITAECDFWCSFKAYNEALQHTKEGMVRHLHAPLFGLTDRLRRAVYKADEKEMFKIIDEMEKELGLIN